MTATTALEYVAHASTGEGQRVPDDAVEYCWEILGYSLVGDVPTEEQVLKTPEVQEALQNAIADFQEWKNSL